MSSTLDASAIPSYVRAVSNTEPEGVTAMCQCQHCNNKRWVWFVDFGSDGAPMPCLACNPQGQGTPPLGLGVKR